MTAAPPRDFSALLQLLRRGTDTPVTLDLTRTGRARGYVVGILSDIDPEGLRISRHGVDLLVQRDGRDVMRRTGAGMWHFDDSGRPVFRPVPRIDLLGPLDWFACANLNLAALAGLELADVTTDMVAGRRVLVLPLPDVTLRIDAEHGTVLGLTAEGIAVRATRVRFPTTLPSPAWEGAVREPEPTAVPDDAPARPTVHLPPAPEGRRELRILCDALYFEGNLPDWRPGDSVRLELSFLLRKASLPGLRTVRRGRLYPFDTESRKWQYAFRAEGWAAHVHSPEPCFPEQELAGYFAARSSYGFGFPESTDVRITHVHRAGRDLVIDTTLDSALPPALPEYGDGIADSDGQTLWVTDRGRPRVRGYRVDTGRHTHTIDVPTYAPLQLDGGATVSTGNRSWRLPLLEEIPPRTGNEVDVGDDWLLHRHLFEDLYVLRRKGNRDQAVALTGAGSLTEVNLGGEAINDGYRLADQIIVRGFQTEVVLDRQLNITAVRRQGRVQGKALGPYAVFSDEYAEEDPGELVFRGMDTGAVVARYADTADTVAQAVFAGPDRIVVAEWLPHTRRISRVAVWSPGTGWRVNELGRG
ncbi:hypothetical protein [Corynebacterium halotolerans]|uniref:hypothetical protein n=1 Tax=Corynebacterium halotolerans TaxID=225326 RepID=UPI003CF2B109